MREGANELERVSALSFSFVSFFDHQMSHTDDCMHLCNVQLRKIGHSTKEGSGIRISNNKEGRMYYHPAGTSLSFPRGQVHLTACKNKIK